jgi:hypothetical protein
VGQLSEWQKWRRSYERRHDFLGGKIQLRKNRPYRGQVFSKNRKIVRTVGMHVSKGVFK